MMKRILYLSFIISSLWSFQAKAQISVNVSNVSAPGLCDGSAMVDTNNFVSAASLTWMLGNTVIQNGGYFISNLCAGQYSLNFMGGGFITTTPFTIGTNVPNPCAGFSVFCGSTPTSGANVCDGSVMVTAVGGTAPYTYQWTNTGGMVTTNTLSNLCIGSYSVMVVDANGCSGTAGATVIVDSNALNPCFGFNGTIAYTNATNASACDGTATLTITGGTSPYMFQWSDGTSAQNASNLCVGTYTVTVLDNNQCSFTTSCTIGSAATNIDSVMVIGNLATGLNVIGTISSGWTYNCTIDLAALDTAFMVTASFGNSMFTQDSLYTTWYLVDTNGNSMYVNYTFSVPFGTTGLYNLILQLYCTIKSQPVYYNIISVLNLEQASIVNNNLSQMNVYPNPVQNELNIGNINTGYNYILTNMDGKIIQSGNVSPTNQKIDMSNVASGTYIVQLKNTQNAFAYRVIK